MKASENSGTLMFVLVFRFMNLCINWNDLSVPSSPAAPVMFPAPTSLTTWMKQVRKIRKTSKTMRTPPSSTSPPSSTCLWLSCSQRESPSDSQATRTVRLIFSPSIVCGKEISVRIRLDLPATFKEWYCVYTVYCVSKLHFKVYFSLSWYRA